MKLFTTIIAGACLLASVSTGNAKPLRPGPYVSGFIGVTVPKDSGIFSDDGVNQYSDTISFDPGLNIGATGGFDFGYLRLEGELSYKHNNMSGIVNNNAGTVYSNVDGNVGVLATMFNAFFDLRNDSPITPYFGGGIGAATVYLSDTHTNTGLFYSRDNDTVFAYQVGTGVEIALRPRLSLDLGYRYFATDKASFNNGLIYSNGLKMESHNFAVGIRAKF